MYKICVLFFFFVNCFYLLIFWLLFLSHMCYCYCNPGLFFLWNIDCLFSGRLIEWLVLVAFLKFGVCKFIAFPFFKCFRFLCRSFIVTFLQFAVFGNGILK